MTVASIVLETAPAPAIDPAIAAKAEADAAAAAAVVTPPVDEAAKAAEAAAAADKATSEDAAKKAVEDAAAAAGSTVDFASLETIAAETGTLPDEKFAELEKLGFPKAVVEEFIGYRMAAADAVRTDLLATVGGEEGWAVKSVWAKENLSPAQAAEFNASMASSDTARKKNSMAALETAYVAAKGKAPNLLTPSASNPSFGGSYRSLAELTADQQNPKYKSDPAFREDVKQKLSRSNI